MICSLAVELQSEIPNETVQFDDDVRAGSGFRAGLDGNYVSIHPLLGIHRFIESLISTFTTYLRLL